jgi:hypothetical protein
MRAKFWLLLLAKRTKLKSLPQNTAGFLAKVVLIYSMV